jgi:hypothetical protein
MSTFSDEVGDTGGTSGRRDFLRKAAVGSGAFLVPMIIRVDPADAQALTSPPPEPPDDQSRPLLTSVARPVRCLHPVLAPSRAQGFRAAG